MWRSRLSNVDDSIADLHPFKTRQRAADSGFTPKFDFSEGGRIRDAVSNDADRMRPYAARLHQVSQFHFGAVMRKVTKQQHADSSRLSTLRFGRPPQTTACGTVLACLHACQPEKGITVKDCEPPGAEKQ
jgi:hypothetical protein